MEKKYSIAEAQQQLPAIVHEAERAGAVRITRRGQVVARLVSEHELYRLGYDADRYARFQIRPRRSECPLSAAPRRPSSSYQRPRLFVLGAGYHQGRGRPRPRRSRWRVGRHAGALGARQRAHAPAWGPGAGSEGTRHEHRGRRSLMPGRWSRCSSAVTRSTGWVD